MTSLGILRTYKVASRVGGGKGRRADQRGNEEEKVHINLCSYSQKGIPLWFGAIV